MTALLALLLVATGASDAAKPRIVKSSCGVVLTVPRGWTARTIMVPGEPECAVHLAPPGWRRLRELLRAERDVPEFAIRVRVRAGTADTVCEQYHLCRRDGVWYFTGYGGVDSAVEEKHTSGGRLFLGTREQRVYDRDGYRGTGEFPDAVIIGGGRVAEIDADGDFDAQFGGQELFDSIAASLRLN
jgi:hypothetical protein